MCSALGVVRISRHTLMTSGSSEREVVLSAPTGLIRQLDICKLLGMHWCCVRHAMQGYL